MNRIKKNDTVELIKGKDAGKRARVLAVFTQNKTALVEGINLVKKHKRQSRQDQQGGIISVERPLSLSNLMPFCKRCSKPARVGFVLLKDKTKTRICRTCREAL